MHPQKATKSEMMPLKLGITGGVGSGKSVVCDYFSRKGILVISADELARQAVMPGTDVYENIVNYFGSDVVAGSGGLDRKKLRSLISRDPDKKNMLEHFVHPEVFRLMDVEIDAARDRQEPFVVIEIPLLFELGLRQFFDFTLTVCADREIRIKRMMNRDLVSYEDAAALLGIQMSDEEKRAQSDFIVDNNGSKDELYAQLDGFYEKFMSQIKITGNKYT